MVTPAVSQLDFFQVAMQRSTFGERSTLAL